MADNSIPESSQKLCLKLSLLFEQTIAGKEKMPETTSRKKPLAN